MRIIFFTRLFYPHIGGVEKHVMEVSQSLIAKGHEVTIITEDFIGKNTEFTDEYVNNIHVYRLPVGEDDWFKKFRIWSKLWKLRRIIEKADVIHCHDVFFWYLPFWFLNPFLPVYTTFHGYESTPIKRGAILQRKIAEKLSNGNICIGDFISKWYGTKPTIVCYGGVETDEKNVMLNSFQRPQKILKQVQDDKVKKNEKAKYDAVFWGRLDDQTSILSYIKTVELVRKKIPDFSLLTIGDGKYKEAVKSVGKTIDFQNNPNKYLSFAHYAFVSRYLSMLEAMIAKKLVFAFYDDEIKKDYLMMSPFAKYTIIKGSPEEMVKSILYYKNHPKEEKETVEKAYQWAKKQTWDKVSEIYLELWH
ncbi:MAG TPA: glycosyltransferase family 4 protein [Patescibacteria group bacterium]|nr:glycosyltransferase family 4 protein [Patescibacteria group bacterium]